MRERWRESKIRRRLFFFLSGLPWISPRPPEPVQLPPQPPPHGPVIKEAPPPSDLWKVDPERVKEEQRKADQLPEKRPE